MSIFGFTKCSFSYFFIYYNFNELFDRSFDPPNPSQFKSHLIPIIYVYLLYFEKNEKVEFCFSCLLHFFQPNFYRKQVVDFFTFSTIFQRKMKIFISLYFSLPASEYSFSINRYAICEIYCSFEEEKDQPDRKNPHQFLNLF